MERLNEEILEFIERRFVKYGKDQWESGNCYYFSVILREMFPCLEIWYEPVRGHFLAGYCDGEYFFDINGIHQYENCVKLRDIKNNDPLWYERLWEDCVK